MPRYCLTLMADYPYKKKIPPILAAWNVVKGQRLRADILSRINAGKFKVFKFIFGIDVIFYTLFKTCEQFCNILFLWLPER